MDHWLQPEVGNPYLMFLQRLITLHWGDTGGAVVQFFHSLGCSFDELRIYDRALISEEIFNLQTWDPTNPVSTNNSPGSLTLTQSQIAENKVVGTVLGNIVGTDPDGDQLTYQLTTGVGDGNNSLFLLETNGTLKSVTVFDYETDAHAYGIRVKVTDEHGASAEGNFTIFLRIEDDTAPVITLNGDANITHEAGNLCRCQCELDGCGRWKWRVGGCRGSKRSTPGTYFLSYSYTDAAGNAAQTVHGECGGYDCPGNYPEWRCEYHP